MRAADEFRKKGVELRKGYATQAKVRARVLARVRERAVRACASACFRFERVVFFLGLTVVCLNVLFFFRMSACSVMVPVACMSYLSGPCVFDGSGHACCAACRPKASKMSGRVERK